MNSRLTRVGALAATALCAITLASTANSTASAATVRTGFIGYADGYGATFADAEAAASRNMNGEYIGCSQPYYLYNDGQLSDGTWWVTLAANNCKGYR